MNTLKPLLILLLRPLGIVYGLIIGCREKLYTTHIFATHSLSAPVISVGNLTLGGTGKTPLVIYLAEYFKNKGYKPAIISRGYKGKALSPCNIVSDYSTTLLDPIQAGDEPFLMAQKLKGVPVLTGKKRIDPCNYAIKHLETDLLILDDGFQHLPVQRDVDLVLFSAQTLKERFLVFPSGVLREPFKALHRCDAILFTNCDDTNIEYRKAFQSFLIQNNITKPIFETSFNDPTIHHTSNGKVTDVYIAEDDSFFVFSGIANPQRFIDSLTDLDMNIVKTKIYNDHHSYTQQGVDALIKEMKASGATNLITTEKDLVKLVNLSINVPLLVSIPTLIISDKLEIFISDLLRITHGVH